MPRVGIIGGIGPDSTIDYYHRIIERYRARRRRLRPARREHPAHRVRPRARPRVAAAHRIVEATADAARALGCHTAGLLGTRFTMESGFYATAFARAGITVVAPHEAEQRYVHAAYMEELLHGQFLPEPCGPRL